ncbi:MAG: hypothetical protein RLZZ536_2495, partial [Planctomycetota bacterium]
GFAVDFGERGIEGFGDGLQAVVDFPTHVEHQGDPILTVHLLKPPNAAGGELGRRRAVGVGVFQIGLIDLVAKIFYRCNIGVDRGELGDVGYAMDLTDWDRRFLGEGPVRAEHRRHASFVDGDSCEPDSPLSDALSPL